MAAVGYVTFLYTVYDLGRAKFERAPRHGVWGRQRLLGGGGRGAGVVVPRATAAYGNPGAGLKARR